LFPNGYQKSTDQWPLILCLHGGSARGEDIDQMKKLGLAEKVESDPNFPFIVVWRGPNASIRTASM
jgi:predicted peptidase